MIRPEHWRMPGPPLGCAAKRQRANARLELRAIIVVVSFAKIKAGLMKIISAGRIRARTPNGTHGAL